MAHNVLTVQTTQSKRPQVWEEFGGTEKGIHHVFGFTALLCRDPSGRSLWNRVCRGLGGITMTKTEKIEFVARAREQIASGGEIRLHISHGRTGMVRARLWHHDGIEVGSAGGGGYDKRGTAIGEALTLLQGPELAQVAREALASPEIEQVAGTAGWVYLRGKAYGLGYHTGNAKVNFDGACGTVDKIAALLGFEYKLHDCGPSHDLVIMTKKGA